MVKWLEIIKLRRAGNGEEILGEFLGSLANSGQIGELIEIRTYRHASFESDLNVHLYWESERPEPNGSALGLRLAQVLEEFGLMNHSVWIDEEK
jgi:hypothetical protein